MFMTLSNSPATWTESTEAAVSADYRSRAQSSPTYTWIQVVMNLQYGMPTT